MESLTISSVTKAFPAKPKAHVALDGIDLAIRPGELFFLLGASGCGKTTLLRCIAGLETPSSGQIRFGERDVTRLPPHLREAAMVFQSYALWPHLTVGQNVAFGLEERKVPRGEVARRTAEALAGVRMGELADRGIDQLSGGQQQRVALARALVVRPRVLLLDEPLSNLDAQLRVEMRREIRRIVKENGLTAIYVTHDQEEALAMADRMAVLHQGKLAQVGTPEEIYRRPDNAHVAKFIGETNLLAGKATSVGAAGAEIATPAGALRATFGAAGWRPAAGEPVQVSVRPEGWTLAAADAPGAIRGVIADQVYLGQRAQLTVRTDLGELHVLRLNPEGPAPIGAAVGLVAQAENAIVLPA
ncbi:MAG: ABC transporter ATP-binding protein [Opitutia bacterium]|jgi:iron(III) transport system ATP-binding protein